MNTNQQRDDSYRGPLSPSGWHCIRDVDDCGSLATADAPPLLGKYRLGSVLQRFILFLDFFSIVACNHIHSSSSQQYQVLHQHHYHPQISSWCKSRTKLQGRCVSRISANVNATVADGLHCRMICGTVPFSARLKASSDGSDVIAGGSAFQIIAAATGKARSPMVLCNDRGTCSNMLYGQCPYSIQ